MFYFRVIYFDLTVLVSVFLFSLEGEEEDHDQGLGPTDQ